MLKITSKERSALKVVLYRLYKKKHYKTNIIEIFDELEKSNTLNMTEINNILNFVKASTPQQLYEMILQMKEYREKQKNRPQKKWCDLTEEEKAKHRESARRYKERNYKSKKKGN